MTQVETVPVLTINGVCGQTVNHQLFGITIAVQCAHGDGPAASTVPPPASAPDTAVEAPRDNDIGLPDDVFQSGSGGHVARATVDRLSRGAGGEGVDEHLLVVTPDGRLSQSPDDYRSVLDSLGEPSAGGTLLKLDEQLKPWLSRDVEPSAEPFVVVVSPGVTALGAEQLGGALRAAADARAPITVELL